MASILTAGTLERFFRSFGLCCTLRLAQLCRDLRKPYLAVVSRWASRAVHASDRYRIVAKLSKALDEMGAEEARRMTWDGLPAHPEAPPLALAEEAR